MEEVERMVKSGLTFSDKVVIVYKHMPYKNYTDVYQGFLVDPSNKRQLDKARQWGTEYHAGGQFKQTAVWEPHEYFTNNENFKITVAEAAEYSSQGGKLSFWNCIVEKDGHKFMIGINQDILLSLIQQSTIKNGVIQEPCRLVKMMGTAGAIHDGMEEVKYINIKDASNHVSKTKVWKVGQSYKTKTKHDIYIGKFYDWFDVNTRTVATRIPGQIYNQSVTHYDIKLRNEPVERLALMSTWSHYINDFDKMLENKEVSKVSQIYKLLTDIVKNRYSKNRAGWEIRYIVEFMFNQDKAPNKPIAREVGNITIEADDYTESAQELIELVRDLTMNGYINIYPYALNNNIGISTSNENPPVFSSEERNKLMSLLPKEVHIDFGDGIIYDGNASIR